MRNLKDIILEKLKISKTKYTLFPKTKEELIEMIEHEIDKNGNECSLNHIDVRDITDMSELFANSTFNGDISKWDVLGVKNMLKMFAYSKFTGENSDISQWDVSNVKSMCSMFLKSKFNQNISNWEINPECNTRNIFFDCMIEDKYKPKGV